MLRSNWYELSQKSQMEKNVKTRKFFLRKKVSSNAFHSALGPRADSETPNCKNHSDRVMITIAEQSKASIF